MNSNSRRRFIKSGLALTAGALVGHRLLGHTELGAQKWFEISLAQWSLHRGFFRGGLDPMNFAAISKNDYGIHAIEYVNQFYKDRFNAATISELRRRADDEGVKSLLIMCDGLGQIGAPDESARKQTVENHKPWVEAAKALGCHSVRVNAGSSGTYQEQQRLAADGLRRLSEFGDTLGINVIVENHGGLSSNGAWLAGVMKRVDHPRCGTLPDFGNFRIDRETGETYDRYKGTRELMPYAKGVSAKSYDFDEQGNETTIDYERMLKIVLDAGYTGYIGIEYEGRQLGEPEGIRLTKALLERLGGQAGPSTGLRIS